MDDKPRLKLLDCSLRLSVIPLTVVSLWLTVTDHQSSPDYGNISFSKVTGIKYMVGISAIAIGYALMGAICAWLSCLVTKSWVFFVSDQVMAYLMVTSWAVGIEFIYLAYNGDVEVTWSEACSSFGTFCTRLKIALVFQFLALFGFLVLALISAYRTFSALEAPPVQNYWEEMADTATTSS